MPWLTRDAEVLASLEEAGASRRRPGGEPSGGRPALLRRSFLLRAGRTGPLDVAWCRPAPADGVGGVTTVEVRRTTTVRRWRLGTPGLRAPVVIAAPEGCFERWRLAVGDRLQIRGDGDPAGGGDTGRTPGPPGG